MPVPSMPFSTRCMNPGLSIVTTTSGRQRLMSASTSASRRRSSRTRGITSTSPITARSDSGNRLCNPHSAIRAPPTPANDAPGDNARTAPISRAPSTSPLASPATM